MTDSTTRLIRESNHDDGARNRLWSRLLHEMRALAHARISRESSGHTLETDALVNELYLKLDQSELSINDRSHFMAVVARQLRLILVDSARSKHRLKRGGVQQQITLRGLGSGDRLQHWSPGPAQGAGGTGKLRDERTAHILELHYFGGLSFTEIAEAAAVSVPTVTRKMRLGKAWLHKRLEGT